MLAPRKGPITSFTGLARSLRRPGSAVVVLGVACVVSLNVQSVGAATKPTKASTTTTTTPVQVAVTVAALDTIPVSSSGSNVGLPPIADLRNEVSTLTIPIVDDPDDIPIDTTTVPKRKVTTTTTAPNITPTGAWQCPVPNGKFTNDWGQPRSGGRSHEGIDMLAPFGSPVYAPVAGTIKRTNGSMSGLTVHLTAEDGVTYVGMHLSSYGASGSVKAGQVIAYVGSTGNAGTTNHLHFEIHPTKRTKTNPYPTLKKYC